MYVYVYVIIYNCIYNQNCFATSLHRNITYRTTNKADSGSRDPSFSAHASSGHRALHPKRSRWASNIIFWESQLTNNQLEAKSWIESVTWIEKG